MKKTIGGDRLGAGGKQEVHMKTYSRSTHDLSHTWRSSMSAGTLVPFLSEVALPGDKWDIDLACEVLTLPTLGPLFGSFKVQLDVFQIPMRLYNAGLHMNKLKIGLDMSAVKLPQTQLVVNNHADKQKTQADNEQVNPSSLYKYLGISGLGTIVGAPFDPARRNFNAIPYLSYWTIYKNYYSNKQEERGMCIHTAITAVPLTYGRITINQVQTDIFNTEVSLTADQTTILAVGWEGTLTPDYTLVQVTRGGTEQLITDVFDTITYNESLNLILCQDIKTPDAGATTWQVKSQNITGLDGGNEITIQEFPLENIDKVHEQILQHPFDGGAFQINRLSLPPYSNPMQEIGAGAEKTYSVQYSQENLGLKTYQSDLLNNWISTEWIDGANGINQVTAVSTTGDQFTIDSLNLANKVYNMLNRIAISGGTYDDWLDAVYTHERARSVENPVYMGSLIKELGFQEVVSTAANIDIPQGGGFENGNPTGTLTGRGKLTGKNKGGKIAIRVDEPSYIMGIISLTPRIDVSQGNKWDINLQTLNDLHKPELGAIGYQDLITEQMKWSDSDFDAATQTVTYRSAGKQPAWINYMTAINRCYGNFAIETSDMFMTLNRRYNTNPTTGRITDLTTYVDPEKYNQIFARTELDSQNFWVQIANNITCRRKMSAKVIPNL